MRISIVIETGHKPVTTRRREIAGFAAYRLMTLGLACALSIAVLVKTQVAWSGRRQTPWGVAVAILDTGFTTWAYVSPWHT
jgi:hypothetical protein